MTDNVTVLAECLGIKSLSACQQFPIFLLIPRSKFELAQRLDVLEKTAVRVRPVEATLTSTSSAPFTS